MAGIALALVDVDLAPRPREALRAVTPEGGRDMLRGFAFGKEKFGELFHGFH